jgi:hypothetical protein
MSAGERMLVVMFRARIRKLDDEYAQTAARIRCRQRPVCQLCI